MTDPVAQPSPASSAYNTPLLIKQLLLGTSAVRGNEIVYRDLVRYDYDTLRQRIGQLASGLHSLGAGQGDTVAVMDWDSHRYLECYFAIPMMGAVIMTVNVRLNHEQILYTLNHARPTVLLINAEFLPILEAIRHRLETVRHFVLIRDPDAPHSPAPALDTEYESLLASHSAQYVFPDFDENTRATTFYTTGTTGLPKGVYFSHRQLVLHTLAEVVALALPARQGRLHRDDVYMPITPMFHVHAWGFPYAATMAGLKQVYPGRYAPDTLLQLQQREGVTFSHCVPTILHMLLTHPSARDMDLRGWKIIIGGSALSKGLASAALARGIDVFSGYGMSETCPVMTLAHVHTSMLDGDSEDAIDIRTCAGIPLPLVDVRIVDEAMQDVPADGKSAGEIVVRAPWLTQGYLHSADASEQLWAGGYLHTSDIGLINRRGYLQITDRLKDVIKTGGEWVSSLDVESVISQHAAVSECAVVGVRDAKWGERPLALIVLKSGCVPVTAEDIRRYMMGFVERGVISRFGVPDVIRFVDALEKTSVGKLDKKAMRTRFAE